MPELAAVSAGAAAEVAVTLAFLLAGVVAAVYALYLLLLALVAARVRSVRGEPGPPSVSRLAVLVPAHDEATLIGRCVRSLREQTYPRDLFDIVVIADNCTDDTAALAEAAGAAVMVRDVPDARGKGHALRWAMDRIFGDERAPDAVIVVDADSVAEREFVAALARQYEGGAPVVQGQSLLMEDGSSRTALRVAAFLLINRVRPAGRAALGLPCNLCGNGMLLDRRLLERMPWNAFTSAEDVEYTVKLRSAGIGPVFAADAILRSPAAPSVEAGTTQQLRWEGGKAHVARTALPRLAGAAVRERDALLLDAALELSVPPLGLLAGAALAGCAAAVPLVLAGVVPAAVVVPWLLALLAIPLFVIVGLRAAQAPASAYRALALAPALVVRKALGVHRLLRFRGDSWVRTQRADEAATPVVAEPDAGAGVLDAG